MKTYIAYGSNMNIEQMKRRCPDARSIGTGELIGYRLTFRGNRYSGVANVEKAPGHSVPVVLWKISANDEKALDVYEGFPHLYHKEQLTVISSGKNVEGMIYVMDAEKHGFKKPSSGYLDIIAEGYDNFGITKNQLLKAAVECGVKETVDENQDIKRIAKLQADGKYTLCPRCGMDTMKSKLHMNAWSRRADIYICDRCGTEEALEDWEGLKVPVTAWACMEPEDD